MTEALAATPAEPDWLWEGYLANGAVTLLAGRPKVGKSTLTFGLAAALLDGRPFLDRATKKAGALLLSEERGGTLKEKARRFGLDGEIHLLMRHETGGAPWPEVVAGAAAHCREHGLGVLVVDTWQAWADIRGDAENSSGATLEGLAPLTQAAGDGLCVVVISHQRKSQGSHGDAVRGSNALTGGVDVVVELERAPSDADPSARVLKSTSRYGGTPEELALELTDAGYRGCGDVAALKAHAEAERIREVLGADPLTLKEIADQAGDVSQATVKRRLDGMVGIAREGTGKRGDPYRFAGAEFLSTRADYLGVQGVEQLATPEEEAEIARLTSKGLRQ